MTIIQFPAISFNSSFLVTTSQVTVSGALPKQLICKVQHPASNTIRMETVPACLSHSTRPTVKLLHSSCNQNKFQPTIQLLCLISDYTPGDLQVTWLKDGQQIDKKFTENSVHRQDGKLASTQIELNITQTDWASASTFTCQVSSQGLTFKAHTRKCTDDEEPRGVGAYLIPPSPLDLYVHKAPKLTCLVVDLENKNRVTVKWTRESGRPVSPDPWTAKTQYNTTVSITSTLPVDAQDWIDGESYKCTVTHPDLPKPVVRSITKATGTRVKPKVYVFRPPEEGSEQGPETQGILSLTCLAQNFFPADISVLWLQNGVELPNNQYSTTAPIQIKGSSPSFFIFSRLEVTSADWVQNKKFTCRVVHEALPNSRFLDKNVSKDPELDLQDLCTEEAESQELEGLWTSTYAFISLFLLSVSYSATVTVLKVKWVLAAMLQSTPQTLHDYINILQPGA
ncbi:Ig epsilon chain C region [Heterocephalus glaber]|nr:Ig epsilon chain C region [Heterocephalus glaber]